MKLLEINIFVVWCAYNYVRWRKGAWREVNTLVPDDQLKLFTFKESHSQNWTVICFLHVSTKTENTF